MSCPKQSIMASAIQFEQSALNWDASDVLPRISEIQVACTIHFRRPVSEGWESRPNRMAWNVDWPSGT